MILSEWRKQWYQKNKEKVCAKSRAYSAAHHEDVVRRRASIRKRNQEIVARTKCRPCMDCGVQYNPWQMDLDHREASQKCESVSCMALQGWGLKRLEIEIAKCDVVCSNCHRERTYRRFHG